MAWFVLVQGQQVGPLSENDLRSWAQAGRLSAYDLVWRDGMPQWLPAGQTPEFAPHLRAAAPGPAYAPARQSGDDPMMRLLLPVGRSGWAIAAGYLGLFSLLGIFAPFAVICGIMAIRDIRKNPHTHGMGRAVFGIVMGGLVTLGLGIALLVPVLQK